MKIIFCKSEDDFGAISFQEKHGGQTVSSIIDRIESGEDLDTDEYTVEVMLFGDVDPLFVEWIKNSIQDYDDSKNDQFWLEGDIIN